MMFNFLRKNRIVSISVLAVLAILSFTKIVPGFQKKVILPQAQKYVKESQEKALIAFGTISVVKGLVAVVEGSDVVGIEVGDIVQPLYDAIDITWKLIALSLTTLYAIGILLKLCGLLGSTFLGISCILSIIILWFKKESLQKYMFFFSTLAFLFFIGIPLSLFLSGKISNEYSNDIQQEFDTEMDSFQVLFGAKIEELKAADLIDIQGSSLGISPVSSNDFNFFGASIPTSFDISWPSINFSSDKYLVIKQIILEMDGLAEKLPEVLFKTGVTWLLDVVVIPIGMLFLLYKLAILFMNSFMGAAKADKFEKAVANTLEKHLKKES